MRGSRSHEPVYAVSRPLYTAVIFGCGGPPPGAFSRCPCDVKEAQNTFGTLGPTEESPEHQLTLEFRGRLGSRVKDRARRLRRP